MSKCHRHKIQRCYDDLITLVKQIRHMNLLSFGIHEEVLEFKYFIEWRGRPKGHDAN
jgi:hypothetical protein